MTGVLGSDSGLFRIVTAGSVDDGKSSLIGRLLYDAGAVPEDQVEALRQAADRDGSGAIDLSLITDGLIAEREQGITIDVAYRYFRTARRKFILADTPGHVQYVRNMVTGASTADAAVVLVDVRKGMTEQTRRHLCIAALLRIPHLVVAVNKMDLVSFDRAVFESAADPVRRFLRSLEAEAAAILPIAAKWGDNVVHPGDRMAWYGGKPLLALLEALPSPRQEQGAPLRFPVQLVQRDVDADGNPVRRLLGRVESGAIAVGDRVLVLPNGGTTSVTSISTFDGPLQRARAAQSIAVTLSDEIDVERGDLLADPQHRPRVTDAFDAVLCWLDDEPYAPADRYVLKHGTRSTPARIAALDGRIDITTLETLRGDVAPSRNDLVMAQIRVASRLALDSYADCRRTGGFILINERTNATVAAGFIRD